MQAQKPSDRPRMDVALSWIAEMLPKTEDYEVCFNQGQEIDNPEKNSRAWNSTEDNKDQEYQIPK